MTQDENSKESSQTDGVTPQVVHYGDIVVTVGQRFDKVDKELFTISKAVLILAAGEVLLLGIHLPEVGPILIAIAKLVTRS
jgi:hypothetical protein